MHVSRSQAQRALGFRFRGFGDVAGGRPLGDKIAVLEGLSDKPCCSACARGKLAGLGSLGVFADDVNIVQATGTNVFSGGAALFALGLVAFFISSRKKRAT